MSNLYNDIEFFSESDVEQKFVQKLLVLDNPIGLGYSDSDFRTKADIRKLTIDKGNNKKLYYPDYAIIIDGLPAVIIEAKAPGEDLSEAIRQARLYATEINAAYPRNINPCEKIVVTDGKVTIAGFWDVDTPYVTIETDKFETVNSDFCKLIDFASKKTVVSRSKEILGKIKSTARYFKPVHMLGGKSVINETVGENSFGANVSIEYKYLFNPNSSEDRKAIVNNAYVNSKRKQSHVAPIDKIIRAAIPDHIVNARKIEDTKHPKEIINQLIDSKNISNEICLLIGSVGSGKSTFTDHLRVISLPEQVRNSTEWINLNLNQAPLSRELIYKWIINESIQEIRNNHKNIDFDHIDTIRKIYTRELCALEKGKASLYPKGSEKHTDIIFSEIDRLQKDEIATLNGLIQYLYTLNSKLLVIVLDNCDKRNRDDQLLMFDVATWLKKSFMCMIFLPIRDTTYDQYRNAPPLDTVIKDLVFRIDPPLLEKVIYARLHYALREIGQQNSTFYYYTPNNIKVECSRDEVAKYLKSIVTSLFQDTLFKRIITGIAGRNIRKGLEIILDFCKSGHIGEDELLKVRQTEGDHSLPHHLIAKILLKGKRKYYSDGESHIKNLFSSDNEDTLPDPFVRISILEWLNKRFREYGPNRSKGYHRVVELLKYLQSYGHSSDRVLLELSNLVEAGCVNSESQSNDLSLEDLVSIAPSGFIHLELLKNINYLSAASEDTFFRENQVAKKIADNLIGNGSFKQDSRQTAISNSNLLMDYMDSYYKNYFIGSAKILSDENLINLIGISDISAYVKKVAENDNSYANVQKLECMYPVGSQHNAQIVSIQQYGFFVEFGLNGSGLIHKSNVKCIDISDAYEVGDWVVVEIQKYNTKRKKFDIKLIYA